MAKKMPPAGRPARTAGAKVPPRTPGVTGGKVRSRISLDQPWNATGKAALPLKPPAAK